MQRPIPGSLKYVHWEGEQSNFPYARLSFFTSKDVVIVLDCIGFTDVTAPLIDIEENASLGV